jgi:hypothetical protein
MAFPVLEVLDTFKRGEEKPLSNGGKWVTGYTTLGVGEIRKELWWGEETYAFVLWNQQFLEPAVAIEIVGTFATGKVFYLLSCAPEEGKAYSKGYALSATKEAGSNEWGLNLQKNESVLSSKAGVTIAPGDKMALWVHNGKVTSWVHHEGTWNEIQSVSDTTFSKGYSGIGGEMKGEGANTVGLRNFEVNNFVAPIKLIDSLERIENPFWFGGKWVVNGKTEGPGETNAKGWTSKSNTTTGNGAYYAPRKFAEAVACIDITELWTEESGELSESSFALYVCYNPAENGSGYAAVFSKKRMQFVFVEKGGDFQRGEAKEDFSSVESIAISAISGQIEVFKKVAGLWTVVVVASDSTYTTGYVALEAEGTEGRAAKVFGESTTEEAAGKKEEEEWNAPLAALLSFKGKLIPHKEGTEGGTNILGMILG